MSPKGEEYPTMRRFALLAAAAAVLATATAATASNDTHWREAASADVGAEHAIVLARQISCGGAHLRCPSDYAKVCNPRNGKCCCAIPGTYH